MKLLIQTKRFGVKEVLFDAEDNDIIKKYTWHIVWEKTGFYVRAYVINNGKYRCVRMHRLIMGVDGVDKPHVDHKNHNSLDNRRCNLRLATISQNTINTGVNSRNTTGYKGVYLYKKPNRNAGKYTATTRIKGRVIHGGYFKTAIDAAKRYNEMVLQYHGEFAYLNKV